MFIKESTLLDELFKIPTLSNYHKIPAYTLDDDEKTLFYKVPGCSKEDVSVTLEDGYIYINAQANVDDFSFNLEKAVLLPENVEEKDVEAEVKDGLLKIHLKKSKKKSKGKKLL
jgi:HSP20 family molecular chaperone IbpA